MNSIKGKIFSNIILLTLVGGSAYYYKDEIRFSAREVYRKVQPCKSPITYSLGSFDESFGISKENFLKKIAEAEKIWERAAGTPLLKYAPDGEIKINLIYDQRQEATNTLKKIGSTIDSGKDSYATLKAEYDAMVAIYNTDKNKLQQKINAVEEEKRAYEKEVNYWNSKGGASKDAYNKLKAQEASINEKINEINRDQNELNKQTEKINTAGQTINSFAKELNVQVGAFNEIGSNTEEFDEGEYVQEGINKNINIYQYEDQNKLLRVLAHEIGHAIGMEHVADTKAIMYMTNQSSNEEPTDDDIKELRRVCNIK